MIDYKTGARPVSQATADADLALTVYAALVAQRLGQPVVDLVLDYVVAGVEVVTTRPPGVLEASARRRSSGSPASLRTDEAYEPRTGPWCARCDLLARCPDGQDSWWRPSRTQNEPV